MIGFRQVDAGTLLLTVEDEIDQAIVLDLAQAMGLLTGPTGAALPLDRVETARDALQLAAAVYADPLARRKALAAEEAAQGSLFEGMAEECEGICGV